MRALPSSARWRAGVFTLDEALAARWTPSALRHAVATGRLLRLRVGVYAEPPADGPDRDMAALTQHSVAATLCNHGVWASHLAGARLAGLAAWAPSPRACLSHEGSAVSTVGGVHVHRTELGEADRAVLHGSLAITSPARTVVDIAREFGVEAGIVTADAALRTPLGTPERLDAAVRRARGRRGVDHARSVLAGADGRSESVLESRSRHRLATAGVPAPLTQVDLSDLEGHWLARSDFFWPEFGVVGEADGLSKYRGRDDLAREKRREDALRDLGLEVVRWTWADLRRFAVVVDRLQRALARGHARSGAHRWHAAQRGLADLPPRMVV